MHAIPATTLLLLLTTLLLTPTSPLQIFFLSCSSTQTSVYPTTKSYNPNSCECLQPVPICQPYIDLKFTGLTPTQSLYYQFEQPYLIQNITQLNSTFIQQRINVAFKGIGSEKKLYFQYGSEMVEMHFSFVNRTVEDTKEFKAPFDWSYVIGTCAALVLILIQTTSLKIYRFEAINIRWWFSLPYAAFAATLVLFLHFLPNQFQYFQYALVGALTLFSTYFFFEQLMGALGLRHRIYKSFYWRDLVSILITAGFVAVYVLVGNTWFLNDIFMFMIVGTFLKVFRIRSIRSSLFFILAAIGVNVLIERLYGLSGEKLGLTMVNNYPSPLQLQMPTLLFYHNRRCSWIQITDMMIAGLLFSFCRRVDSSLNISVYSIFSGLGIVLSAFLQILLLSVSSLQLPQDVFSVPVVLGLLSLISSRRGEWSVVWYGGFYDGSGERVSLRKEVEWGTLTRDMERSLLVN